jgi:putative ATPase
LGTDLFAGSGKAAHPAAPLAEKLRPRTLDEVVGQQHLLGPGKPLRVAFESGKPHSMILWGPPGSGKTTLARLMAQAFEAEFSRSRRCSPAEGHPQAMQAAERAGCGAAHHPVRRRVHRFNKAGTPSWYVEAACHSSARPPRTRPSR